jgi:hypothetical protein
MVLRRSPAKSRQRDARDAGFVPGLELAIGPLQPVVVSHSEEMPDLLGPRIARVPSAVCTGQLPEQIDRMQGLTLAHPPRTSELEPGLADALDP